eukprot:4996985-Prymnesium_polylepis.1
MCIRDRGGGVAPPGASGSSERRSDAGDESNMLSSDLKPNDARERPAGGTARRRVPQVSVVRGASLALSVSEGGSKELPWAGPIARGARSQPPCPHGRKVVRTVIPSCEPVRVRRANVTPPCA